MGHHEKIWLQNFHGSTILFYRWYVDDTFCLFNSDCGATIFFHYINSRHPNIRFTIEKQVNHKLPFLDVLTNNHDPNSSLTSVYCKKTFTGSLTNYFSFTSYSYKVGLIKTLVDRAYKINNTWLGFHEDINKLTDILKKNIFPAHLIEKDFKPLHHWDPKQSSTPEVPFPPLHLCFTLSYPRLAIFLLSLKKRFTILLSAITMTWILNWFLLCSKSATCLVRKTLSLMGSVHKWFISLYVLAIMPVMSVKPAGIFPQVLENT